MPVRMAAVVRDRSLDRTASISDYGRGDDFVGLPQAPRWLVMVLRLGLHMSVAVKKALLPADPRSG
jgi:hypothetical protein